MAEVLASEQLEEIRDRLEASRPGPWSWSGNVDHDRVELCSADGYTLLWPSTRTVQYVFEHANSESYALERARERYLLAPTAAEALALLPDAPYEDLSLQQLRELATNRGLTVNSLDDGGDPNDDYIEALRYWDSERGLDELGDPDWPRLRERQVELAEFLAGDLEPEEGARHLVGTDGCAWLSRGVATQPDLRCLVGPYLESYRDLARYHVLAGKTLEAHLAAGGFVTDLYRRDLSGIDTPEATFIAASRKDVEALVAEVDRLRDAVASSLGTRARAVTRALWFGLLPWRLYERECHYAGMSYLAHLGMNLAVAWRWLTGGETNADRNFELDVNGEGDGA